MGGKAVIPVWRQAVTFKGLCTGYAGIHEQHILPVFEVNRVLNLQLEVGVQVNMIQLAGFLLVLF